MRKFITVLVMLLVLIGATPVLASDTIVSVYPEEKTETPTAQADENKVERGLSDFVVNQTEAGALNIEYKESNDPTKPIEGAQFTIYLVATMNANGGYDSIIPAFETFDADSDAEEALEKVKSAYNSGEIDPSGKHTRTTNAQGFVDFPNLKQGLYLAEESMPAEDHLASMPFFVALPYMAEGGWQYSIVAKPKSIPTGRLVVEKKVEGEGAEKDREFHFSISLDVKGDYEYERSDGQKGELSDGDTFTLSDGQNVLIKNIPSGANYRIMEKEANMDGYTTKMTGSADVIECYNPKTATFTNTKTKKSVNETDTGKDDGSEKKGSGAQTGDSNLIYILGGICLLALIVLGILLMNRRKLKQLK